jgi:hypothetical protein
MKDPQKLDGFAYLKHAQMSAILAFAIPVLMIVLGVLAAFLEPLIAILALISGFVWFAMVLGFLIFTYQGLKQLSKAQKETTEHAELGYTLAKVIAAMFVLCLLSPIIIGPSIGVDVASMISSILVVIMRYLGLAITFIIGLILLSEDVEDIKPLVKIGQGAIVVGALVYTLSLFDFLEMISGADSMIMLAVAVIHFIALSKFAKVNNI